ncbi:MAG TPA: isoamylase early set domain-containing protein, partial [Saprospiraceae bacterium]|nr:isoamylase early set domain-containing protein [Saprospiraceae bacterium]
MIKKKYSKNGCKVTFSFKKGALTGSEDVRVLGDFNGWNWENGAKLNYSKGEFSGSIDLELGKRYEFKYASNEHFWFNDTHGDGYTSSPYYGIDNTVIFIENVESAKKGGSDKSEKKSGKGKVTNKAPKSSETPKPEKVKSASKLKAKSTTKVKDKAEKVKVTAEPIVAEPVIESPAPVAKGKPGPKPKATKAAPAAPKGKRGPKPKASAVETTTAPAAEPKAPVAKGKP